MKSFVELYDLTDIDEDGIDALAEEIAAALGNSGGEESEEGEETPDEPVAKKGMGRSDKWWEVYHALVRDGKSKESAAKIASTQVKKHNPGGADHDQSKHGNWADGSSDDGGQPDGGGGEGSPASPPSGQSGPPMSPSQRPHEDQEFVRQTYEKYLAQAGPRMEHVMSVAGMDQMSHPGKKGEDTMGMYGVWEGDRFLGYTEERAQWQAQVLAEMQSEQIMENGREPGTERRAVIMSGLPGAGKSHLIKTELNKHLDTRDFLTINADDVKEKIIFEDAPPSIDDVEGWELSSMVHEESSHMRKLWENNAIASGTNVILDITAANSGKTKKLLGRLREAGYEITMVHADVGPDEALASAMRRAVVGGTSEGKLGRIVPPDFIRGMASAEQGPAGDVIDDNFDDYLADTDRAFWFRTYPLNIERDRSEHKPTQLLWSS